jgi:hypothetical protein
MVAPRPVGREPFWHPGSLAYRRDRKHPDERLRGLDREHFIGRPAYHYDQVNYIPVPRGQRPRAAGALEPHRPGRGMAAGLEARPRRRERPRQPRRLRPARPRPATRDVRPDRRASPARSQPGSAACPAFSARSRAFSSRSSAASCASSRFASSAAASTSRSDASASSASGTTPAAATTKHSKHLRQQQVTHRASACRSPRRPWTPTPVTRLPNIYGRRARA